VADLAQTRELYEQVLGCRLGRSSDTWVDFDFFGHQVSAHLKPDDALYRAKQGGRNRVEVES